ncbi:MAG: Ig-like domain repeat protein, partial [Acidimicrobiales bacterium]
DAMSDLPGFQPTTSATTTTGTASSDNASPGQVVHLSAQVGNGDEGGSLSFDDNGSAITGCGTVPLFLAANCDTSSLSVGDNEIVVHYSGDARSGASASSAIDVVIQSGPPAVGPPTIPGSGQVYLGAWVRPQVTHTAVAPRAAVSQELEDLPSFNGGLARPLSVVHVYQPWSYPASTRQVVDILADGAIPMIDWYCGDTDANVIAGNDDALITAEARELAAFKAPVFLRWYWEPNFPGSADYAECIGSLGPAGYAAAFRHIHDLFAAAGASNVAFVFSMSTSGPDHDLYAYYPGSNYVDWIAADGYLRTAAPPATGFSDQFGSWYSDFADFGKPMMISETATFAGGQSSYLQQVESQLAPGGAFPLVKAIMYFDAPGDEGLYTYPLDSAGMTQFASLAADPLFQPARSASTVAATASPASSSAGQRVVIDAQVSNTDYGGSTSFFVNGAPLTGCQSVPVGSTSSCKTTSLPVGSDQIVAVYSGDAEVQGSAATTVTNVVTRPAVTAPPGSGSSSDSGSVPAPSTPQFAFPPFFALPDIGGVASLGFPDGGRAPFAFTITPTLPNAATTSPGGGSDLDPITWTTNLLHGRDGAASVLVPTGGVILFLLAAYMVTTWAQDRKRSKRAVHAPAGDDAVDLELGPIDAGGGVTPP